MLQGYVGVLLDTNLLSPCKSLIWGSASRQKYLTVSSISPMVAV